MMRTATMKRQTAETNISTTLNIDGTGKSEIATGIGFFDHMLLLLTKHGFMDLQLIAQGDLQVDGHHTVEDTGIVLGQALAKALGDKSGIKRYGTAFVPMDEALAMVSLDISGRPFLVFDVAIPSERIGDFDSELTEEFLRALSVHAGLTLHVRLLSGKNSHHIVEAIFKALGRALDEATSMDERIVGVMSSKGML
ncbi:MULTISPECIES: imidazoleglycerol-phosphate dehydratase HisB [Pelosinus]|jgi:imidazoleglycerol-phosphate dehydratase|uniref:Imidazoleglycerol-phosphate dehydratase n=1 Tax=Pelosinus fermentans B4 TaxID=1149862 RepID=I8RM54_9FIRM|nr:MULTISPECIES: imidazoleglycerol-phosphate dehydratase HisB [Pelosinus]EIW19815.1 imidazoleglycerol-phosphate dehydratase [Pelosinus fermentans B4]EIW21328.1 Imidazoleglycerol-phosphate dehydratase [Pelosinus fermentans A11]OAM94969.1 Imidazoleglycerol-phosphate dehydratase [Pelosinus fermentans DSM 17108]SDR21287.1 imidazoleglycerol-phosphate dehydratase [Pelosinus fermentans]